MRHSRSIRLLCKIIPAIIAAAFLFTLAGCGLSANGKGDGDVSSDADAAVSKISEDMCVSGTAAEDIYEKLTETGFQGEILYISVWKDDDGVDYFRVRASGMSRDVYLDGEVVLKIRDGENVYVYVPVGEDTASGAGHIMETGQKDDPEADMTADSETSISQTIEVILNKNSKKYHYPGCRSISQISEANAETRYVSSIDELLEDGYSPCSLCAKDEN